MTATKRTRRPTMPIPESIREQVYSGVWGLAYFGSMQTPRGQFGNGTLTDRRHGIAILWSTALALRFSELQKLTITDLAPESIYVQRSKRGKSGFQSVVPSLIALTIEWRQWYMERVVRRNSTWLLPSHRGGMLDCNAFNRDVCEPIGALFGFPLSSHCFRDSACQLAYSQTESIRSVQALLGHQSVKTTEHYLAKQRTADFQLQLPGT